MSIKVMSAVYDSDLDDVYDVSVMLALANHADDYGVCYPSISRICKLSRCKERKAQNVIRSLQDRGYLSIDLQAGPRGTNLYRITPAPRAPRTTCTPHAATLPPHETTNTPAQCAPETSVTVKEPSIKSTQDAVFSLLVNFVSEDAAISFIQYRRKHKSKALTETGAKRLCGHLQEILNNGFDPSDALGMAEERGWASVQPDWYFNAKGTQNARTNGTPNIHGRGAGAEAGQRSDPALEKALRLAGISETPGNFGG